MFYHDLSAGILGQSHDEELFGMLMHMRYMAIVVYDRSQAHWSIIVSKLKCELMSMKFGIRAA